VLLHAVIVVRNPPSLYASNDVRWGMRASRPKSTAQTIATYIRGFDVEVTVDE
jgi:hypothetical protein